MSTILNENDYFGELEKLHILTLNAPDDAVLSCLQNKLSKWVPVVLEEEGEKEEGDDASAERDDDDYDAENDLGGPFELMEVDIYWYSDDSGYNSPAE